MKSFLKNNFWLILIVVIAAFLRLYKLAEVPASLNWDEAAIGWNAKTIFHTRRDEYGNLLPLVFKSFGDYKAPLYIYLTAPIVGLFKMNAITIRLISVLSGIISVVLIFLLTHRLTKSSTITTIAALLMACTPWPIMMSRGGFEQNLSLMLIMLGILLFLKSQTVSNKLIHLSALAFCLSLYAYHSAKIFTPLFVLGLIIFHRKQLFGKKLIKNSVLSGILTLFLLAPLLYSTIFSKAASRFASTSIFNQENKNITVTLTSNYFNHFTPGFLFFGNQDNYRQQMQKIGPLLLIEAPFLFYGLFIVIKSRKTFTSKLILYWLIIGPIAASITKEAPHQIRSFNMLPALIIITAIGINQSIKSKKLLPVIITILFSLNFLSFFRHYFIDYKIYSAKDWQYGYKQVAAIAQQNQSSVDQVVITSKYGQPHIFTLVYQDRDPLLVFWGAMSQYLYRDINWYEDQLNPNKLYIATPEEIPTNDSRVIDIINFPDQTPAFVVAKT